MRFSILSLLFICVVAGSCKADDELIRLDLEIFKENKTGKLVFVGKPTKITDGDTIVLANIIKIRMDGIDAPETKQKCLDDAGKEYDCGKKATEHLKQIIGGDRLHCKLHKYDRFGRYIMTCYKSDNTNIHAQMIKDGYAVVSTYGAEKYLEQEMYARQNGLGVWKGKIRHPHCFRHQKKKDWSVKNLCDNGKYYVGWKSMKAKSSVDKLPSHLLL